MRTKTAKFLHKLKKCFYILTVILIFSCGEKKSIIGLSKKIEKLEETEFPTRENQQETFRLRNTKLRNKIINSQLNKIKKSKANEFYVIESYDHDWGFTYLTYLIIDGKIIGFEKDDLLKSFNQIEVNSYNYKNRIQLLTEKKLNELEKLYSNKGLTSTHIFVVSKSFEIQNSLLKLENYNHEDENN